MTALDEAIRLLEISGEGTKQKALEILKKLRRELREPCSYQASDKAIERAFEREI